MAHNSAVMVTVSVGISGATRISYRVHDGRLIEFSIGDGELSLVATEPGLYHLAARIQEALRAVRSAATRNEKDR